MTDSTSTDATRVAELEPFLDFWSRSQAMQNKEFIQSSSLPPPSAQVSIIGSEAGFSPCSHPDSKQPNRQRSKKKMKKKEELRKNYNNLSTTN